jgi:hypothetical protein
MHNIDRTMSMETGDFEAGDFEAGDFEAGDFEAGDLESGALGYEGDFEGDFESDGEFYGETVESGELTEEDEVDLAAELLTITNEDELDQFIGKFFRRVGRGIRRIARNPVFRAVGGMLKGVAKRALPIVGGAVVSFIAPGVGTAIGGSLGQAASKLFEVDLEAMSDEDAQFEVARRYVRLTDAALRQAARMPTTADPRQTARRALAAAARLHAPGLARALGSAPRGRRGGLYSPRSTGRWIRRGRHIVVFGA